MLCLLNYSKYTAYFCNFVVNSFVKTCQIEQFDPCKLYKMKTPLDH
jgi:hypothetical protein